MEVQQNANSATAPSSSSSPRANTMATSNPSSPPLGLAGPVAALALASAAICHMQDSQLKKSQERSPPLPLSSALEKSISDALGPASSSSQPRQLLHHPKPSSLQASMILPPPQHQPPNLTTTTTQASSASGASASNITGINNNNNNNNNVQKRPMNAFLMFCKKHRKLVKKRHPALENRDITKILGDLWSKLDKPRKRSYIELARQYKEIYIKANPEFKWYKTINQDQISAHHHLHQNHTNNLINLQNHINVNSNSNINHADSINSINDVIMTPITSSSNSNSGTISGASSSADISSSDSKLNKLGFVLPNSNSQTANNNIQSAPKPPKKRYLEKEYNGNGNGNLVSANVPAGTANQGEDVAKSNKTKDNDGLAMIFDQDNIGRAIEHALSDSLMRPNDQSATTTSNTNVDCGPVDFSLNRTVKATRQTIISNIIDIILPNLKPDSDNKISSLAPSTNSASGSASAPQSQTASNTKTLNNGIVASSSGNMHKNQNTHAQTGSNSAPVTEFDLEKRLSELPSLELNDDEPQHDGLATLAEAAVAVQRDAMSK